MIENPKILIVRPDRIGDVVLSTPLPREIKRAFPGSFVAVLVKEYTRDIYLNNPFVDELIIYNETESAGGLCKKLRKFRFDYSLTLLPTERLNWILFFSGIKKRIGVGYKFYQFLTNTKSVFRNKYIPLRHESDYCLDEIRKLGIEPQSMDSEIFLSEEEKKEAEGWKKSWCLNGEMLIGINSTSGNSSPNMPASEYAGIIRRLKNLPDVKIAVMDLNVPESLQNLEGIIYPNKGNSLRESIINFSVLDLLVSSSTGPMHIAAGLKVPTLSLFCPLPACSPQLWSPKGNKSEIILPDENYCKTACPGDPKKCRFEGKGGIDSEKVLKRVKEIIQPETK